MWKLSAFLGSWTSEIFLMGPLWLLHLHPKETITLPHLVSCLCAQCTLCSKRWGSRGLSYSSLKIYPVVSLSEPPVCPASPSSPVSKVSFFSLCIQSILVTHSCKAVYSLKCICNPQINTRGTFVAILDMCKVLKI